MDEALGCARVKVQYGDDDQKIEVKHLLNIMVLITEIRVVYNYLGMKLAGIS
jgi:hypothetical protein